MKSIGDAEWLIEHVIYRFSLKVFCELCFVWYSCVTRCILNVMPGNRKSRKRRTTEVHVIIKLFWIRWSKWRIGDASEMIPLKRPEAEVVVIENRCLWEMRSLLNCWCCCRSVMWSMDFSVLGRFCILIQVEITIAVSSCPSFYTTSFLLSSVGWWYRSESYLHAFKF